MPYGTLDFVIAGVQKGGTTSLAEQISSHPNVSFCHEKEPHFFSKNDHPTGRHELHEYWSQFHPVTDGIYGEASTSYTFFDEYPETAARLYAHNPNMKIIIVLRNPIQRVVSHIYHRMRHGLIPNGDVMASLRSNQDYIQRSCYYAQLKPYFDVFPDDQIHLLRSDQVHQQPLDSLYNLLTFLGLNPHVMPEIDTSAKNISDASVRLGAIPLAKTVLNWLKKQPWAWRLTPYIPMKTSLHPRVKSKIANSIMDDLTLLAGSGWIDVDDWLDDARQSVGSRSPSGIVVKHKYKHRPKHVNC